MTSSLHQQVRRTIRRHGLVPPGARVLIGLSGGSDSVALTRLLLDLAEYGEFTVAGLAHLNHQLRASAERDEWFCRHFAQRLGLSIVVETADVRAHAESQSLSIEDAARRLRYAFLERVAADIGADRVAVGHTQDDQAETFLLKLMRGAGLTGLGGIYPRRGAVIRPLLDVTDVDLRAYLASQGQEWVEDESNDDLDNPRNRVRHRILPELERAAGGSAHSAISRAAALIREDGQWLDELSEERFRTLAVQTEGGLELDVCSLVEMPPPVLRRVLLQAMRASASTREVGLEHVEAVAALLSGTQGGVDVPGSRVELRGGKLVLLQRRGGGR
ncbi:MAG: tRNA lysidine(34) synthetase TilS [Acidobacteria bacterium]|nr:tRNA lysidine(34) synthetase TilS [Acidobacteriota bacterium]